MSYEWGKDSVRDAVALYAKLFYFMGKEMIDTFGEDGEQALRRATQKLGFSRGETLRERHKAQGLPINVRTLFEHYDLPKAKNHDAVRNRINLDEDSYVSETLDCHLQQIWEELGGEEGNYIGSIYCDEFHWAMWSAYDEDIVTEIPELLTKYDPCCRFEVHREQEARQE